MATEFTVRYRKAIAALGVAIRSAANEVDLTSPIIISGAGAPSGDEGHDQTHMVYIRNDASSVDTLVYFTYDGGTAWNAVEAGTKAAADISIADAGGYYVSTDVEAALQEVFSLMASTSNTEGASLVGIEDAQGYYGSTDVEAALAEAGLFVKRLSPSLVNRLFDDFQYQTGFTEADHHWVLNSGTDGAAVDPDVAADEGGLMRFTSGAAGTGVAADGAQIVGFHPVQADNGGLIFEARVQMVDITGSVLFVGLTDSKGLEIPATIGGGDVISLVADDCVGFLYDPAADTDEWFGIAADSTVQDAGNATTGVAPVNGTWQRLLLTVSADGSTIDFAIDGVTALTLTGDVGVSPDVDLYPTIVTVSAGAASKVADADYVYLAVDR